MPSESYYPESLDTRLPEYSAEALSNLHITDLKLLAQRVVAELARRAKT